MVASVSLIARISPTTCISSMQTMSPTFNTTSASSFFLASATSLAFCAISSLVFSRFCRISLVFVFSACASLISLMVRSIWLLAFCINSCALAAASRRYCFFLPSSSASRPLYFSTTSVSSWSAMRRSCSFLRMAFLSTSSCCSCFSNLRCWSPVMLAASSKICFGKPIFLAISKANDEPGLPVIMMYMGCMKRVSNSMAPLTMPSWLSAKSFKLA